jgi:Zn-dependent protease with chaperone function
MQVTKILKKSKLERYYNVRFLQVGGMAFLGSVFFDNKYLEVLLDDELLAVGAHEFTHLKKRHGIKKFFRLTVPAATVGVLIGIFLFSNNVLLGSTLKILSSLLAASISGFFALVIALHINSKWLRQQETECDLSSIEYLDGEAMISALIKLNNLRPRRKTNLERLLPNIYPTLEQRINSIRVAAEYKRKQRVITEKSNDLAQRKHIH